MSSIIEQVSALAIGTVEYISPNEIKVLLDLDAPQATALNTGVPSGFPRINGFVLVPSEGGSVVGLISWMGIERSAFPKRTGLKDFGLIDLPFPMRKMALTPLGTLIRKSIHADGTYIYKLERGVSVFPSVGDTVLLPTAEQLTAIVESQDDKAFIQIGTAPLAANARVLVDPDKMFGRHLAVLGNTGSGKSCTVAGLIRWCLQEANTHLVNGQKRVNARFIILDPNGEYQDTFSDMGNKVKLFKVPPAVTGVEDLTLPAWMWNSEEWSSFANAAPGTQRPLLLRALREMRAGRSINEPFDIMAYRRMNSYKSRIEGLIGTGLSAFSGEVRARMACASFLQNMMTDAESLLTQSTNVSANAAISNLATSINTILESRKSIGAGVKIWYNDFSFSDLESVNNNINSIISTLNIGDIPQIPNEDSPIPFDLEQLPSHLESLAADENVSQFIATLTMRIRMMIADRRLNPIVKPVEHKPFEKWLDSIVGTDEENEGQIAVIDLSLVPADVLHISIAIIARIVFEATQRYRKVNGNELPTVLVLEEAHNFVQRGSNEDTGIVSPSYMCRKVFEKIAREGRKFGLGLVLSSQRPSELSPTVLSQCNTFILHRIVNDRDQELVSKLVPDNLGELLKGLPSLPSRQAILVGWATSIPVLVEINELQKCHCPKSSDPKFWDVWTGIEKRQIDWKSIADEWVKGT